MPRVISPLPNIQTGYARSAGESEYPQFPAKLIGAWVPGIQNSGTAIYDLSKNRNNVVLNSPTTTKYTSGFAGRALNFPGGTSDYINIGTGYNSIPSGNFTLSMWCRPSQYASDDGCFGWSGSDDIVVYPNSSAGGATGVRIYWRDNGANFLFDNAGDRTGKWLNIVFLSRSNTAHELWVNGTLVDTSPNNKSSSTGFNNAAYIGGWEGNSTQRMHGDMDAIYLFDADLIKGDIELLYEIPYAPFVKRRRIYAVAAAGAFELNCEPGAYSISGVAANAGIGQLESPGAYTLSGVEANGGIGTHAAPGSYALAGIPATMGIATPMDPDAYALSGVGADLLSHYLLNAEPATYLLSAPEAQFGIGEKADPGAYSLTGILAQFGIGIDVETSSYLISGVDAGIESAFLNCEPGSFVISGVDASFSIGEEAEPSSYLITGFPVLHRIATPTEVGVYTLNGNVLGLGIGEKADPGSYLITGFPMLAAFAQLLETGAYDLTGIDALLVDSALTIPNFIVLMALSARQGGLASITAKHSDLASIIAKLSDLNQMIARQ